MMRTSTGISSVPPTRRTFLSWRARRSLTWVQGDISPTSSRKRVPPLGQLEHALLVGDGAGEGAADVAEELALEEVLGERGAVDGDEGVVAAGALEVDGPGGHLLARPALAGDQDGRVRRGDLLDEDVDLLHRPALADHLLEAVAVLEVPLEEDVLLLEPPGGQAPADDDLQLLDVERLDDVVERPGLEGLDGLGDAAVGRDQDDREVGPVFPGVAEDVHAVGPGHLDVGHDQVDLFLLQDLEAPGGREGGLDRVAFLLEDDREQVEEALFVVDDQDRFHGLNLTRRRAGGRGSVITTSVPLWSSERTSIRPS